MTHVFAIVGARDAESSRENSWPAQTRRRVVGPIEIIHEAGSAQKNGARGTRWSGHDIHAPMNPVTEIDVDEAGRTKHDLSARRRTSKGVRRRIVRSAVRLRFDNAGMELVIAVSHNHDASHEFVRDNLRRSSEEVAGEAFAH